MTLLLKILLLNFSFFEAPEEAFRSCIESKYLTPRTVVDESGDCVHCKELEELLPERYVKLQYHRMLGKPIEDQYIDFLTAELLQTLFDSYEKQFGVPIRLEDIANNPDCVNHYGQLIQGRSSDRVFQNIESYKNNYDLTNASVMNKYFKEASNDRCHRKQSRDHCENKIDYKRPLPNQKMAPDNYPIPEYKIKDLNFFTLAELVDLYGEINEWVENQGVQIYREGISYCTELWNTKKNNACAGKNKRFEYMMWLHRELPKRIAFKDSQTPIFSASFDFQKEEGVLEDVYKFDEGRNIVKRVSSKLRHLKGVPHLDEHIRKKLLIPRQIQMKKEWKNFISQVCSMGQLKDVDSRKLDWKDFIYFSNLLERFENKLEGFKGFRSCFNDVEKREKTKEEVKLAVSMASCIGASVVAGTTTVGSGAALSGAGAFAVGVACDLGSYMYFDAKRVQNAKQVMYIGQRCSEGISLDCGPEVLLSEYEEYLNSISSAKLSLSVLGVAQLSKVRTIVNFAKYGGAPAITKLKKSLLKLQTQNLTPSNLEIVVRELGLDIPQDIAKLADKSPRAFLTKVSSEELDDFFVNGRTPGSSFQSLSKSEIEKTANYLKRNGVKLAFNEGDESFVILPDRSTLLGEIAADLKDEFNIAVEFNPRRLDKVLATASYSPGDSKLLVHIDQILDPQDAAHIIAHELVHMRNHKNINNLSNPFHAGVLASPKGIKFGPYSKQFSFDELEAYKTQITYIERELRVLKTEQTMQSQKIEETEHVLKLLKATARKIQKETLSSLEDIMKEWNSSNSLLGFDMTIKTKLENTVKTGIPKESSHIFMIRINGRTVNLPITDSIKDLRGDELKRAIKSLGEEFYQEVKDMDFK